MDDQPMVGEVVDLPVQTLELLDRLSELYERWEGAGRSRERSAQGGSLFGPKMMMNATEGYVFLACAEELRQLVLDFGASQQNPAVATGTTESLTRALQIAGGRSGVVVPADGQHHREGDAGDQETGAPD